MAKLSAYGQREVARLERERETPADTLISWERTTFAFMESGRVLSKRDVKFRSENRKHSYGWKKCAGAYVSVMDRAAAIERLKGKGYTEVR